MFTVYFILSLTILFVVVCVQLIVCKVKDEIKSKATIASLIETVLFYMLGMLFLSIPIFMAVLLIFPGDHGAADILVYNDNIHPSCYILKYNISNNNGFGGDSGLLLATNLYSGKQSYFGYIQNGSGTFTLPLADHKGKVEYIINGLFKGDKHFDSVSVTNKINNFLSPFDLAEVDCKIVNAQPYPT